MIRNSGAAEAAARFPRVAYFPARPQARHPQTGQLKTAAPTARTCHLDLAHQVKPAPARAAPVSPTARDVSVPAPMFAPLPPAAHTTVTGPCPVFR